MAKETKQEPAKGGKKKRLHLREIRTRQARDGSLVHHHTYADDADSPHEHPERGPMATSKTPDEAGGHVAEMFSMNQMGGGDQMGGGGEPEPGAAGPGGEPEQA